MFTDDAAVAAGLADEVMTFDEALSALADFSNPTSKGNSMAAEKLNSSTSLTPAAAKTDPAAPAAAAAEAAAVPAKTMSAPGPGEKCELCGQTRAETDEQEEYVAQVPGAKPAAEAAAIRSRRQPRPRSSVRSQRRRSSRLASSRPRRRSPRFAPPWRSARRMLRTLKRSTRRRNPAARRKQRLRPNGTTSSARSTPSTPAQPGAKARQFLSSPQTSRP